MRLTSPTAIANQPRSRPRRSMLCERLTPLSPVQSVAQPVATWWTSVPVRGYSSLLLVYTPTARGMDTRERIAPCGGHRVPAVSNPESITGRAMLLLPSTNWEVELLGGL